MSAPDEDRLEKIKRHRDINSIPTWSDQQWLIVEVERLRERDTALTRTNDELQRKNAEFWEGKYV